MTLPGTPWAVLAIVLAAGGAGFGAGWEAHGWKLEAQYNKERAATAEAEVVAVAKKQVENDAAQERQRETNRIIGAQHDSEMSAVRKQLATAQRMRKPAFCTDQSAGVAQAGGAGGGNAASPGAGLLPAELERRIRALIAESEETAATARACQEFVRRNGLVP